MRENVVGNYYKMRRYNHQSLLLEALQVIEDACILRYSVDDIATVIKN